MARILIVDDDEMDRVIERSMLDDLGHTLMFAGSGETALTLYRREEVDLVITDLAMPELNGLRLIREILEIDPEARIIAISGVSADQLDLAVEMGALAALFKPVEKEELVTAVDTALQHARRRETPPNFGI
jgi:DNA-binding NtrC family response regulator